MCQITKGNGMTIDGSPCSRRCAGITIGFPVMIRPVSLTVFICGFFRVQGNLLNQALNITA